MSYDLILIFICAIFGLLAHGCWRVGWLAWLLRTIFVLAGLSEFLVLLSYLASENFVAWSFTVTLCMFLFTVALLFLPFRQILSYSLTTINQCVSGQALIALFQKKSFRAALIADKIFVPTSMPHINALWVYVTCLGILLNSLDLSRFNMPMLPIPLPVPIDQLFSYNGLGLIMLSVCGVGIMVTRKPREVLQRLGIVKPTAPQVGLGLALIIGTFAWDYLWSVFTHNMPGGLSSKLSNYNAGTFTAGGGAGPSAILALATGLCAGIGEETLIRGALQPVFGILPAGILHGVLHGQFTHAPTLMLQIAAWSTVMGIFRHYTNTTTTIIAHAGFNFLTTFLFAFNP